jgi:hypothetical protein
MDGGKAEQSRFFLMGYQLLIKVFGLLSTVDIRK